MVIQVGAQNEGHVNAGWVSIPSKPLTTLLAGKCFNLVRKLCARRTVSDGRHLICLWISCMLL
jgi:hypothetical protein